MKFHGQLVDTREYWCLMIDRIITNPILKSKKNILLLGPRQVGKSTLMSALDADISINLANEVDFMTHSSQPEELEKLITIQKAKILSDGIKRAKIKTWPCQFAWWQSLAKNHGTIILE